MSKVILLSKLDDRKAVVAAFQDALDAVLNPDVVKRLAAGPQSEHEYQYVHPNKEQSAVGGVSIVFNATPNMASLFVELYAAGYYSVTGSNEFVAAGLASRLEVSLKGTSFRQALSYDKGNRWYSAHLKLPIQQFRDNPHGLIRLR